MVGLIEMLRQNDPARTTCYILLRLEPSDADLAQALEQNPFVTQIEIGLEGEERANWTSLLRVIATRSNLETVKVHDAFTPEERTEPAGLKHAILRAMQQNTAIRTVQFVSVSLPTDISTFVDNASLITSFRLHGCDGEQGASSELAAALQRNTNIETLELELARLADIFTIPILEGLRSNVSLKTLIFNSGDKSVSDEYSHAIHQLLGSTTSIKMLEWHQVTFSESLFHSIAQPITSSQYVSELKFGLCQFQGRESIAPLQSILLNKQNLTTLCFYHCDFGGGQVHSDIISLLSRQDSLLRCFEFHGSLEVAFPGVQFENLLRAIEKSKLGRFNVGSIETPEQFQTLTQSIPSMKLKELEVEFYLEGDSDDEDEAEGEFGRETIRQDLLHAVKNNFSLLSLKGELSFPSREDLNLFESAEDKKKLAFYTNRNESLDQWVDNPKTVDRKLWPEALGLAQSAGPDSLFPGLRSVLESEYVSLPGARKRKRPQYYAPS